MSVSIIMPCYSEEEVIEKVVRTYYNEIIAKIEDSEFIVVDDCSKDNSYAVLKKLKNDFPKLKVLKTPTNSGHGKAVRMGYEAATKDYVFQVDSDNQSKAQDFWKLYSLKDTYGFILGFRKQRCDPILRLITTKALRLINLFLFGVWINDINCPFRLIKKKVLVELLKLVDKNALAPNIMISILAKKRKVRMIEVPITHYERKTGQTSITDWKLITFSMKVFWQLTALRRCMKTASTENK
ncbi:MAG: glycosyltransferase family 2 protein [Deltaproteobacteria bacterium]|nr:glycosyltransferase family 2 protein [Deltaproteobacteria bacterium]